MRAAELYHFLRDLKKYLAIMSSPDDAGRSGFAAMFGGYLPRAQQDALDKDEDGMGGIQTIVRATLASLASTCRSREACAVFVDVGGRLALERLKAWVDTSNWTVHEWMREEVLEKHSDVCRSLCSADGHPVTADADTTAEEAVFVASFRILSPNGIELRTAPASNAAVVGRVKASCKLRSRARRGLWLRVVADRGPEGWRPGHSIATGPY